MAITLLDQETQIRNTAPVANYNDTIAPSEANFETNPASLEDDLNNLRSQLSNILDVQAGDWFTDLNVPSALETGAKRGVNDINTDLHAVEKKRILARLFVHSDVVVGASTAATGTLTLTGQPLNTETITIGSKVYTFQTSLTNVDGNVLIGASPSDSLDNLIAAINLAAGAGSTYAAATTANTDVSAAAGAGDTMDLTALVAGTHGNLVATTDTLTNGSWGSATLTGGAGGDVQILDGADLPSVTTAAVGSVTTLGIVAAAATTFGTFGLDVVAGSTFSAPKNLCEIVDSITHDPILDGGQRVWGLFQTENATDAHTMTGSASDRAQISFIKLNATGTAFEAADMGGETIHYSVRQRKRFEDLTEQDFLGGAEIDLPAGTTVTRDAAYLNQGSTPVNLTTNATLDLEGASLVWKIRDDLEADLFSVVEGSAGGTSEVQINAATDVFRSDAASNDFDAGAAFDTGAAGTTINVGVTANQIDSGGALTVASGGAGDLRLDSAALLSFGDQYEAGSTWATPLVLADSSAEWDAFETAFGEVSLLNAIVAAKNTTGRRKVHSIVGGSIAADVDVSGPTDDANLDTDLGDLSAGTFVSDYDIFLNGALQVNGANAAANKDVYPGTSLANGQLKFEKKLKLGDVITVIDWIG